MNGRAAKRRRRRQCEAKVATLLAWCLTEDDLPDARQSTHDNLIRMMGDRRTGGVTWRWWQGDEANNVIDLALADPGIPADHADYYRRMRAMLREHGGYIVAASAPGVPSGR